MSAAAAVAASPRAPSPEEAPRGAEQSETQVQLPQPASQSAQTGAYSLAGTKANDPAWQCQDAYLVLPLGGGRLLGAVFDGHGCWGQHAAETARIVFAREALRLVEGLPPPGELLAQLFRLAHQALAEERDSHGGHIADFAGTTATVAIVDAAAELVTIGYVGDSRLVLVNADGHVAFETADHLVDDVTERRVLAAGGEVRTATICGIAARRVYTPGSPYPGIMMSRSLGDLVAHRLGLDHEPEIHGGLPFPGGSTLVLCSDGVWEHVTAKEAAMHCQHGLSEGTTPMNLARSLVELAHSRWPADSDDITAVVIAGPPGGPPAPEPGRITALLGFARLKDFQTSTAGMLYIVLPSLTEIDPRREAENAWNQESDPIDAGLAGECEVSEPGRAALPLGGDAIMRVLPGCRRLHHWATSTAGLAWCTPLVGIAALGEAPGPRLAALNAEEATKASRAAVAEAAPEANALDKLGDCTPTSTCSDMEHSSVM